MIQEYISAEQNENIRNAIAAIESRRYEKSKKIHTTSCWNAHIVIFFNN